MKNLLFASIFVLAFCCSLLAQSSKELSCPKISITPPAFLPGSDETVLFSVAVFPETKYSTVSKEEIENLEYFWTVDSGKIVKGQGTKFVTIKIDSFKFPRATVKIKGLPESCPNTATETIIISPFSQKEEFSTCPKISIIAPSRALEPKENAIFTVDIAGENENPKIKYFWSVENGKIIEGQGTRRITIGEMRFNATVTAKVDVIGLSEDCPKTDSQSIVIPYCPDPTLVGEFDLFLTKDTTELDKLIAVLKDDSTLMAYVIIYSDEKIPAKELKQKQNQIRKYLSDNNIPQNRAIMINGGEKGESLVRLYTIPDGATPPNF